MTTANIEFVSDRNGILHTLTASKENTTAVGINARVLGMGTFITCVDDIMLGSDIIIVLKPYDATGHMLERNKLNLSEIQSVLPFASVFQNPFVKSTQFNSQMG